MCPGQQRLGAAGLRNVSGDVRVGASPAPADTLRAAGVAPPPGAGQVDLESGAPVPSWPRGTIDGLVAAPVTSTAPVVARATGALAPGLLATQVWRHTGDEPRPRRDPLRPSGSRRLARRRRRRPLAHRAPRREQPGANVVTVAFDVFGRRGPIASAEGRSLSIPPRERVVVSLDALAPDEASPAVHVIATGGVVSAVLSDQWIDGATARGIDDSTPAAAPATTQVVAGLDVAATTSCASSTVDGGEALVQVTVLTDRGPPAGRACVRSESHPGRRRTWP